jgi:hypothetical protein
VTVADIEAKFKSDLKRTEEQQAKAQCDKEQRTDCKPASEQSVLERNLKVWLDFCIDASGHSGKNTRAIAKCNAKYDKWVKDGHR